jgi:hypothetical protein
MRPAMTKRRSPAFDRVTIDALTIEDEQSFRHVALYADLKDVLRRDDYTFRVQRGRKVRGDRALLLNLTYFCASDGGDILAQPSLPADVVTHVAWHHLASKALGGSRAVEALFLGEAIASAFDVYLIGRLLGHSPRSSFLATQVPAIAEAAKAAGLSKRGFEALLHRVARHPEQAFEELRSLLFDATLALYASRTPEEAAVALETFDRHRFSPVMHHYELSNWVLHARAYGDARADRKARAIDRALRREAKPLAWLTEAWGE